MAKDLFHDAVKIALEKEGWVITHEEYRLKTDLVKDALKIDIAAERLIIAQKGLEKIAVEVKSFLGDSLIYDFHEVLGQILIYQINLELQEPDRLLFLAIPALTYEKMLKQRIFEVVFERYNIHFLIYEPVEKSIILWKS
jgi:hypothetical protein